MRCCAEVFSGVVRDGDSFDDETFSTKGLELDGIRPRRNSGVDKFLSCGEASVVVHACLRDDEAGVFFADGSSFDRDDLLHGSTVVFNTREVFKSTVTSLGVGVGVLFDSFDCREILTIIGLDFFLEVVG